MTNILELLAGITVIIFALSYAVSRTVLTEFYGILGMSFSQAGLSPVDTVAIAFIPVGYTVLVLLTGALFALASFRLSITTKDLLHDDVEKRGIGTVILWTFGPLVTFGAAAWVATEYHEAWLQVIPYGLGLGTWFFVGWPHMHQALRKDAVTAETEASGPWTMKNRVLGDFAPWPRLGWAFFFGALIIILGALILHKAQLPEPPGLLLFWILHGLVLGVFIDHPSWLRVRRAVFPILLVVGALVALPVASPGLALVLVVVPIFSLAGLGLAVLRPGLGPSGVLEVLRHNGLDARVGKLALYALAAASITILVANWMASAHEDAEHLLAHGSLPTRTVQPTAALVRNAEIVPTTGDPLQVCDEERVSVVVADDADVTYVLFVDLKNDDNSRVYPLHHEDYAILGPVPQPEACEPPSA